MKLATHVRHAKTKTSCLPTLDIDGLSLTVTKLGRFLDVIRRLELLHFGYVSQWETFRQEVTTSQIHEDMSIPR
jgi:hypothetical protein